MIFRSLTLNQSGEVMAEAEGHPTEVIEAFHSVAKTLLSSQGRWRITEVRGFVSPNALDSEMEWVLKAAVKSFARLDG